MYCQNQKRKYRSCSSWMKSAVVLLTFMAADIDDTEAYAPSVDVKRMKRRQVTSYYRSSDESPPSRGTTDLGVSLSSPVSIYSTTAPMNKETAQTPTIPSLPLKSKNDRNGLKSSSRVASIGRRHRHARMIRSKSLSSGTRIEVSGGTTSTDNKNRADLLNRDEEGILTNQLRSMREAIRIRDDLLAATNEVPTEDEWARTYGVSPVELRRIMYEGKEARSVLVSANEGLVTSIAKRHYYALKQATESGGGVGTILTLHDMIQEGNMGIMKAAERFEPERGLRFSTYATYWIRQRILKAISDSSRIIRLPAHVHSMLKKISTAKKEIYQHIGRVPSTRELAHYLEISEEKLREYSKSSRNVVSLELPVRSGGTIKEDRRTIGDFIVSDAPTPEEHAQGQDLKSDIRAVVDTLEDRERDVLVLRFGLDDGEPMTIDETAIRLDITRDRVRLVETRALNKLRNPQRNYRLKEYVSGGHQESSIDDVRNHHKKDLMEPPTRDRLWFF